MCGRGFLSSVHALNGANCVETINAIPTTGGAGRLPFFARHDLRHSSLRPDEGEWARAMLVPGMDLGLMLSEERISLLVWDVPTSSMDLLAEADLGSVERILVAARSDVSGVAGDGEVAAALRKQGFAARAFGHTALFERDVQTISKTRLN